MMVVTTWFTASQSNGLSNIIINSDFAGFIFLTLWRHASVYYLTITSLGRLESKKKERKEEVPTVWQQVGLLYLDDKRTASAGTKSLPFILKISPTSTCENKWVTGVHSLQNSADENMSLTSREEMYSWQERKGENIKAVWIRQYWCEETLEKHLESPFLYCWTA